MPRVFHGEMQLSWIDPLDPDRGDLDGVTALWEAARVVDRPHEPPMTTDHMRARLRHGWDGEPPSVAAARNGDARVVGLLELWLPEWDNRHLGYVEVVVDPALRRRGLGRALLEAALERLRASGRTLVMTESYDSTPGHLFAGAMGLTGAMKSAQRRQELERLDWSAVTALAEQARAVAVDYELVRMPVPTPDELMPAVVEMVAAINDAPLDDLQLEDEVFTPERIRAFVAAQEAYGRRLYDLAARHRPTGKLAGHTAVVVEAALPYFGHQLDTSVLAAHRGHRLGLLLKTGMLAWLRESEPQLRTVDTWNALSNRHMIEVNEALGYRVVGTATTYQREV